MSALSFLTILRLVQESGIATADRAFYYPSKIPLPVGLKNGRTFDQDQPVRSADLVLQTLSFENDYFHLCHWLEACGLPIRAADRQGGPYLLLGGVAPSTNPLPLVEIADAIYLGEAEAQLEAGLEIIAAHRQGLRSPAWESTRTAINQALAELPGFFVPAVHRTGDNEFASVSYASVAHFEEAPSFSTILSPNTAYASMNLIEIGRGCPRYCKFCLAGFIHTSTRWKRPEALQASVERALPAGQRLGMIAAIPSQHPQIVPVLESLRSQGLSYSLSSQSFSSLTPKVMELLVAGGMETLTIGLETFDEDLQKRLGKPVPFVKLTDRLRLAISLGIRRFRAYIMIGLPGEDPSVGDQEIIDKSLQLRDLLRREVPGRSELSLSINPFIPKPLTPWESAPMLRETVFETRIKRILKALQREPDIAMKYESPRESWVQGVLSIGDAEVGRWLIAHYRDGSPYQSMRAGVRKGVLPLAELIHESRPGRMDQLLAFIDRGADPIGDRLRVEGASQVLTASTTA